MTKLQFVCIALFFFRSGAFAHQNDTLWFNLQKEFKPQSIYSRDFGKDQFLGFDYKLNEISYTLVLHLGENNQNNLIIAPFGVDSVSIGDNIECARLNSVKSIQIANRVYDIIDLDVKQRFIVLNESKRATGDIALYDEKIPPLAFERCDGSQGNLSDYLNKDKYVYIDFWGLWCPQCLNDIPDLKQIYARYNEKLTIVSLNKGDSSEEINQYLSINEINWVNGLSTRQLERWFFVEGFPHGALFSASGDLILMGCKPSELLQFLKTN